MLLYPCCYKYVVDSFWPRCVEASIGKSMVSNPVCCKNDANEWPLLRDSFGSMHMNDIVVRLYWLGD